jgi:hypothetical protein
MMSCNHEISAIATEISWLTTLFYSGIHGSLFGRDSLIESCIGLKSCIFAKVEGGAIQASF